MKPFNLLLLTSAACLMANQAMATDGTILFTGEIIAASCVASAGGGTTISGDGRKVIEVNLGKVSMDSLGKVGGPEGAGIGAGATMINLNLDCGNTAAGLNTVRFGFDPMTGSGIDPRDSRLLKTTGDATGVGIAILDDDGQPVNLSANEAYTAPLTKTGEGEEARYSATLNMRATYVTNGDVLKPGSADGMLPFTLTYE